MCNIIVQRRSTASTHQAPRMTQLSGIRMSTRLLDEMRDLMRRRHYSIHTERAYRDWIRRYVRFHNMQSRDDLRHGEEKIEAFLTHLARDRQVAASTQNQAMNALVFLYKHVLKQPLSGEINADSERRKVSIPVVLTREETARLIALMSRVHQLIVKLLYGSGLRITECLRLRVQDVDLEMKALTVRNGKGDKDRITTFPEKLVQPPDGTPCTSEDGPWTGSGGGLWARGHQYHHDLHSRPAARWPRSHEPTGRPRHRVLTPSHPRSSSAVPHGDNHDVLAHDPRYSERRGACQRPRFTRPARGFRPT